MLCSLKGKWKTHHYILISLSFFFEINIHLHLPHHLTWWQVWGHIPAEVPGLPVRTRFPECAQTGCALHPPPPTPPTHTHTPQATPATRSPQVCIEKAQCSLARSCPEESGSYVQRAPSKTVFPPTPFLQTPFIIAFGCLVFLFVLMRPVCHIPGQLSLSLGVGVAGFFPLTFSLLGLRWMLPVCVCVLHLLLCLGDLCPLFLTWGGMSVPQIKRTTKRMPQISFKRHKLGKKNTQTLNKQRWNAVFTRKPVSMTSPVISTLTRIQTPNLFTVSLLRHLLKTSHSHFR